MGTKWRPSYSQHLLALLITAASSACETPTVILPVRDVSAQPEADDDDELEEDADVGVAPQQDSEDVHRDEADMRPPTAIDAGLRVDASGPMPAAESSENDSDDAGSPDAGTAVARDGDASLRCGTIGRCVGPLRIYCGPFGFCVECLHSDHCGEGQVCDLDGECEFALFSTSAEVDAAQAVDPSLL